MSCTPNDLIQASKPIHKLSEHEMRAMQILTLCRMAQSLNANNACDLDQLRQDANCFICLPDIQYQWFLTMLLCQIVSQLQTGGGFVVSPGVYNGHYGGADPGFVPTTPAAIAYDLDPPNALWTWNSVTKAWM